ncbi:hypothetical protein BLD25_02395 [Candidatus Gracilibacteria bacterium GN02-872]|nr:hypothetical protein BLD25_02395 [Candidatus Gracilibacteria bacterium GN02-872]
MSKTNNIFLRENLIRSLERRQSLLTTIRGETKQKVEKIIIKESFYKFLDKVDKIKVSDEERSKIYDFIFCLLNRSADLKTNKKPSSANITSMYGGTSYSRLSKIKSKKEIIDLMKFLHKEDIPFSSISGIQNKKGIPNLDELKKFIEFLKNEKLLEYLSSISSMQSGKGFPNLDELKMFIEFLKKEKLLEYLSSISGMQNGKGIPHLDRLEELINFARNNQIPFSFVSSMQNGKGIPDLKILGKLIAEARKKELNLKELSGKQLGIEATLKLVKTAYE